MRRPYHATIWSPLRPIERALGDSIAIDVIRELKARHEASSRHGRTIFGDRGCASLVGTQIRQ